MAKYIKMNNTEEKNEGITQHQRQHWQQRQQQHALMTQKRRENRYETTSVDS